MSRIAKNFKAVFDELGTFLVLGCMLLPVMIVFYPEAAFATSGGTTGLSNNILKWIVNLGGTIAAIVMVIMLIKQAIAIFKGDGSWGKFFVELFFMILVIGLMAVAGSFTEFQNIFSGLAGEAIKGAGNELAGATGSTATTT